MLCNELKENLSAYLDNELPINQLAGLNEHLANCPECRAEHSRLSKVSGLVKNLPIPLSTARVFTGVRLAIAQEEMPGNSLKLLSGLFSGFGLLTTGFAALIAYSPVGLGILALIKAVGRNFIDIGALAVKISTRISTGEPFGFWGWPISLSLFLGFGLAFYLLRKVLSSTNLGGPLYE